MSLVSPLEALTTLPTEGNIHGFVFPFSGVLIYFALASPPWTSTQDSDYYGSLCPPRLLPDLMFGFEVPRLKPGN